MTPAEERLLQQAAAALTAHYYDKGVRDQLLRDGGAEADRAFALLDQAAAHVAGPANRQDPQQWLAAVPGEPGLERSLRVFAALAEVTGISAEQWASTFALAASPEQPPAPQQAASPFPPLRGPASPF